MIIGRDHELEELGGLVGALASGPKVLLIEGEAGYTGVGRDKACFPNRFHSRRIFTIVP